MGIFFNTSKGNIYYNNDNYIEPENNNSDQDTNDVDDIVFPSNSISSNDTNNNAIQVLDEYKIQNIIQYIKEGKDINIKTNINEIFDNMNNLAIFTPSEMIKKGVYEGYGNFYGEYPDNINLNDVITVKEWFSHHILRCGGIITEDDNYITSLWINKLNELYSDFDKIKESGDKKAINARKQSILELGWNPEIQFNKVTRERATLFTRDKIKVSECNIIDISNMKSNINDSYFTHIHESSDEVTKDGKYPIYLVLVYTASTMGKAINKYTKSIYSHAAIGLDSSLKKLYSFNMKPFGKGGFSIESVDGYIKDNEKATLAVYSIFLSKKQHKNITKKIEYFINNAKNTSYSILNVFGIMLNKPIHRDNEMVCSQFVDSMLKIANANITDKDSSLVTPKDLYSKANEKKIYKVFEGRAKDYLDVRKNISKVIKSINTKVKSMVENSTHISDEQEFIEALQENMNDINKLISLSEGSFLLNEQSEKIFNKYLLPFVEAQFVTEAKEFPVQFDKEGNLLIKKNRNIDFNQEYTKSHKLLKVYETNNNLEGIKYEISKLWYLNCMIEDLLYGNKKCDPKDKIELNKSRARILNDFNKYLKYATKFDREFNFREYYEKSPFSDSSIKINNSTLKYTQKMIKGVSKIFL